MKQLESYESMGELIDALLQMDDEKKFVGIAATAYAVMEEEKHKEQMKLFISIVDHDLKVFTNNKERNTYYKMVYDKVFDVKEAENDSFDIGVDHDKIHEFIVDRLGLQ
jgi:hypothetical protein